MARRLAAILSADVVGYSRLMAADEEGTLARLKAHRKEPIKPKTAEHQGRVVKLMGDGTLMGLGGVVDALSSYCPSETWFRWHARVAGGAPVILR